jgi:N-acetylmuramoyl-L-alanine amidase
MLGEAKSDKHISIGALEPKKPLKWASYSSIGKELDYVSIGFYGFGTSFTTPTFCAMCGLVQDFFIDKTGRALVRSELIDFINDNLIDVEEEGFDIKTGHGLFILPDPNTINISKYVPEYSGNIDYTGFPEIKEEKKMYKVFLGVGHGGNDSGAVANGLREADINLNIALACQEVLIKHGVEVLLSRYTDENDPVSEGIIECNNYNPDIAIDIHTNAGGGDGFEVFTHSGGSNSRRLAEFIETETKELNNSRGIKTRLNSAGKDYYAFIRDTNPPAIIVECAFIDNKEDVKVIDTVQEQKAFGIAYAKGILKYFGIEYKEPVKKELVLTIDQKAYTINGVKKEIEVAPRIENGRTLVPIAVLRDLGLDVEWNAEKRTVTVRG